MAVGLCAPAKLYPVDGVRLGTACAGVRVPDRKDLVVLELASGAHCAAVFTQNVFSAAPVLVARQHLAKEQARYLVINTGYANAGTGEKGVADALACCQALAGLTECSQAQVLPFSTGIIGEPLPVDVITAGLPEALAEMTADGWQAAAEGIMTTDTLPKGVSRQLELNGQTVTVTGIAKGAGMIRPNMATMLAFVATDLSIAPALLEQILAQAVGASFNRISVDGDTSTNDACVLVATGLSDAAALTETSEHFAAVSVAIEQVCLELAQAIIRDGEGATKFLTVQVTGGGSEDECCQVARGIAQSPLVKTACFGSDPNWGRILAAIGNADVADLDIHRVALSINGVPVIQDGMPAKGYTEAEGAREMAREEIRLEVALGRGQAAYHLWTCDLSYDYVRINADYRT